MSLAGDNFSVGMFQYVPSLLTCPDLVDLMVHFLNMMMMPAAMVVVSLYLLMRVCGSAPSLLPWRRKEPVFTDHPLSVSPRLPFLL